MRGCRELTRYLEQEHRLLTPGLFVKSSDHTLCGTAGSLTGSSRIVRRAPPPPPPSALAVGHLSSEATHPSQSR